MIFFPTLTPREKTAQQHVKSPPPNHHLGGYFLIVGSFEKKPVNGGNTRAWRPHPITLFKDIKNICRGLTQRETREEKGLWGPGNGKKSCRRGFIRGTRMEPPRGGGGSRLGGGKYGNLLILR